MLVRGLRTKRALIVIMRNTLGMIIRTRLRTLTKVGLGEKIGKIKGMLRIASLIVMRVMERVARMIGWIYPKRIGNMFRRRMRS
jgi:hypothetical protein